MGGDTYFCSSQSQLPFEPQIHWEELKYYMAPKSQVIHHVIHDGFCSLDGVRIYQERDHNVKLSTSETTDVVDDHILEYQHHYCI